MSTQPGRGSGIGTSRTCRWSTGPGSSRTTARMVAVMTVLLRPAIPPAGYTSIRGYGGPRVVRLVRGAAVTVRRAPPPPPPRTPPARPAGPRRRVHGEARAAHDHTTDRLGEHRGGPVGPAEPDGDSAARRGHRDEVRRGGAARHEDPDQAGAAAGDRDDHGTGTDHGRGHVDARPADRAGRGRAGAPAPG